MTDDPDEGEDTDRGGYDLPDSPNDRTTAQDAIDSLVDRKGAADVRENFAQYVAPLAIMGMDVSREDVHIPEPGEGADP